MKAMNMKQAWEMANEIFPTDYEKDEKCSSNAGYSIYRSTCDGHWYDYICDLNDRLEINLSDGRTINIWIDASYFEEQEKEEEARELVEEDKAAKAFGAMTTELYEAKTYKKMAFCIDGSKWNHNEVEQTLYRGLGKVLASINASDMVASYCDSHGIKWETICDVRVNHYEHGKNGELGGHYVVTAYVGIREEVQ